MRFLSESPQLHGLTDTDKTLGESRLSEVRLSDMSLNEPHNLPCDSQKMSPIPCISSHSFLNDSLLASQIESDLQSVQSVSRLTQLGVITSHGSIVSLEELSNFLGELTFKSSKEGAEEVIKDLTEQV